MTDDYNTVKTMLKETLRRAMRLDPFTPAGLRGVISGRVQAHFAVTNHREVLQEVLARAWDWERHAELWLVDPAYRAPDELAVELIVAVRALHRSAEEEGDAATFDAIEPDGLGEQALGDYWRDIAADPQSLNEAQVLAVATWVECRLNDILDRVGSFESMVDDIVAATGSGDSDRARVIAGRLQERLGAETGDLARALEANGSPPEVAWRVAKRVRSSAVSPGSLEHLGLAGQARQLADHSRVFTGRVQGSFVPDRAHP